MAPPPPARGYLLGTLSKTSEGTHAPSLDARIQLDSELLSEVCERNCHPEFCHAQTLCPSLPIILYNKIVVHSATASPSRILRNLTKHQYVRETELDKMKVKYPDFPSWDKKLTIHDFLTLGHIVFAHICWSSDPCTSMGRDDSIDFRRGIWAGDRFDIIPDSDEEWVKELQQETSRWKDVSRDTVDELERIFVWACLE
ncbi:unnamed protein product [Mycena citricolor]|uniref:Uncharacterized protein n=1 Tax=Mycena citricolor TaxID=2018698 RepID=A0AAD2HQ61_9AGAR|nr:unnamed protein product [Mycena citricolor]